MRLVCLRTGLNLSPVPSPSKSALLGTLVRVLYPQALPLLRSVPKPPVLELCPQATVRKPPQARNEQGHAAPSRTAYFQQRQILTGHVKSGNRDEIATHNPWSYPMKMRLRTRPLFIALAAIPIFAVTACFAMLLLAGSSAGGTLASGRSVITYSDAITLKSAFSADTATIETAGKQIIVSPTALVVDGISVAEIDGKVTDVEVHINSGIVSFIADGRPVAISR
ncbi:hypothetical protein Q31a_39940 [Aureliella helgolandensis]|uniref:Uncharacterized protein n=1 Tax=Aureliella helgolandensis TaxID=2527968 RepID=A0A518GAU3_9BACT|nr:hypothetical protein Q31a_39940 [Aureliella helgolandensis]